MKNFLYVGLVLLSFQLLAIPTEEGLLKNLNNSAPQIGQTIVRLKVLGQEGGADSYYRVALSNENPNAIQVLQQKYSGAQMTNAQLKDVKFESDLFLRVKRDGTGERSMFYSVLGFLVFNKGTGLETLIEKSGSAVLKTKSLYNEDKMRLLRQYKTYLSSSKSKSDADSPLNPQDPKEKQRVQELFRANSLRSSPNVKLSKMGSVFMWHADWKNVQGYFSNEERRLKILEVTFNDNTQSNIELDQYGILNGINEFPKIWALQSKDGRIYKIQVLGVETKTNKEKSLMSKYEESKKITDTTGQKEDLEVFLF